MRCVYFTRPTKRFGKREGNCPSLAALSMSPCPYSCNTCSSVGLWCPPQAKALDAVLKKIKTAYGQGSIMKMSGQGDHKVERMPSGCLSLDVALGGGYPRGRIIEVSVFLLYVGRVLPWRLQADCAASVCLTAASPAGLRPRSPQSYVVAFTFISNALTHS